MAASLFKTSDKTELTKPELTRRTRETFDTIIVLKVCVQSSIHRKQKLRTAAHIFGNSPSFVWEYPWHINVPQKMQMFPSQNVLSKSPTQRRSLSTERSRTEKQERKSRLSYGRDDLCWNASFPFWYEHRSQLGKPPHDKSLMADEFWD